MSTTISSAPARLNTEAPWRERLFPNGEWGLLLVILCECTIFAFAADNFFTFANGFEIVRLSVELGLLALALTPIIITGGIDLSVGSTMGLTAVALGSLWRDAHLPLGLAVVITLIIGATCGRLNAALIA